MQLKEVGKMGPVDRFLYWIKERHRIYRLRAKGREKPWTDDEVLQRYFFTNPYREHDKVTVWVQENIREPYAENPNLWFMLCIARQINRPETLQEMMDEGVWPLETWRGKRAGAILDARQARGLPVYTGAYMIRAESGKHHPWYSWSKNQYMTRIVLGKTWQNRRGWANAIRKPSMETATKWLMTQYGWGGFMSYEVVCDLRYTPVLCDAHDVRTWANMGPGARRGLNRIAERPHKQGLNAKVAVEEMRGLLAVAEKKFQGRIKVGWMPPLELREIEHSLCEFDKYERMRLGQGKSKRSYPGK